MNLPSELSLVFLLSRFHMDGRARIKARSFMEKGIDWVTFTRYMRVHRLTGPVYSNLARHFPARVPRQQLMAIKAMDQNHIKRGLNNAGQVIRLSSAFRDKGIPILFCKGVSLSIRLYQNPLTRHSGDIDLLVSTKNVQVAEALLFSLGYRRVASLKHMDAGQFRQYMRLRFHAQYRAKGLPLVELHWRFCNNRQMFPVRFADLWRQRQIVYLGRTEIPIPGDTHNLAFLFIHGTKHGWERFFWLKDIADYIALAKPGELKNWLAQAREHRIGHFAMEGFFLLERFYGSRLHPDMDNTSGWQVRLAAKIVSCTWSWNDRLSGILALFLHKVLFFNRFHYLSFIRSQVRSRSMLTGTEAHSEFYERFKKFIKWK